MYDQLSEGEPAKIERVMLERTSSPNSDSLCEHCEHQHARECCMYLYDDVADIMRYALFKKEVDEPYWTMNQSEDFDMTIGNVTPKHFPCFSINDPDEADKAARTNFKPPPLIYVRQYFWPLFLPNIHQLPLQNINQYTNPHNIRSAQANCQGNVYQHQQQQFPHTYQPIVMRQLTIPQAEGTYDYNTQQPKIIESHSFFPVAYGQQLNWRPF